MNDLSIEQATEAVYQSLNNDNEDIDMHISNLKSALAKSGGREAVFKTARLAQANRAGRKMMQSYFRKRGVNVTFEE